MSHHTTPHADQRHPSERLFEMLAHSRRRLVLRYVRANGSVPLAELVAQVTAWEAGRKIDAVSRAERAEVAASLHHVHLPKLADAEMISFDRERETVAPGEAAAEAEPYLRLLARHGKR